MAKKRAASDSDDAAVHASAPTKKSKTAAGSGSSTLSTSPKVTSDGDEYWEISDGGKRRLVVSSFRNMPMVSVREYYSDGGQMKPGKKGISLTVAQFSAMVVAMPAVLRCLEKRGQEVPRPDFDTGAGSGSGKKNKNKAKGRGGYDDDDDDDEEEEDDVDDDEDVEIKDQDEEDEELAAEDDEEEEDERPARKKKKDRKVKREKSRKNFEETSDEDEG